MTMHHWFAGVAFTLAVVGCDSAKREKAHADSITVDSLLHVAQSQAAADSTRRADSIAAAAKAAPRTKAPAPQPKAAAGNGTIIGRDSVNIRPKVINLPVVSDTAKRRPPS
jgi:hypothetical protein